MRMNRAHRKVARVTACFLLGALMMTEGRNRRGFYRHDASPVHAMRADKPTRGEWGDQGDGTYANPLLPGDFSDLDAIRVGEDYYAISSTLQYSPGMVVLHSKDLVNWEIIGHVVDDLSRLDPELNWDKMNRAGTRHLGRLDPLPRWEVLGLLRYSGPGILCEHGRKSGGSMETGEGGLARCRVG
jgi:hypothetical protein